jgi:hypothetical protein
MEPQPAQVTPKGKQEKPIKQGTKGKDPKKEQSTPNQPTTQRVQLSNIHRLVSKNTLEQTFKEKCGDAIPV